VAKVPRSLVVGCLGAYGVRGLTLTRIISKIRIYKDYHTKSQKDYLKV
jgi:hypothetical protein